MCRARGIGRQARGNATAPWGGGGPPPRRRRRARPPPAPPAPPPPPAGPRGVACAAQPPRGGPSPRCERRIR
ncbi:hypothetical protein [Burkholderia pseudomallei]|uniref:hypothetical protein n=1 Tax=Burkholderia pseudomallei TaxID=28450 RepID=UPI00194034C4|nr:hypothetical protein [Burkholderia pseudomallei]